MRVVTPGVEEFVTFPLIGSLLIMYFSFLLIKSLYYSTHNITFNCLIITSNSEFLFSWWVSLYLNLILILNSLIWVVWSVVWRRKPWWSTVCCSLLHFIDYNQTLLTAHCFLCLQHCYILKLHNSIFAPFYGARDKGWVRFVAVGIWENSLWDNTPDRSSN